jgi:nicotinate-nucleotide adenylyltransferase
MTTINKENNNKTLLPKRVGIYGGTFNPIHIGHLITARAVMEARNLSEIIFIPAYRSPLKIGRDSISSANRFEMVKIAIANHSGFNLSDYEINKKNTSYTINTLKHFKEKYEKIELIIGYDNYLVFDKWYKSNEILDLADVVVLNRLSKKGVEHKMDSNNFIFVETPTIQISSTLIRKRVKEKLSIDFLVTPEVNDFIKEKKFYQKEEKS